VLPSLFAYDPATLGNPKLITYILPPPLATIGGFRSQTVLDLHYIISPERRRGSGWRP